MTVSKYIISWFRREAGLFFNIRMSRGAWHPLFFTVCCILIFALFYTAPIVHAEKGTEEDPVIIVIDPGHGGDNLGAEYEDYTEKEMTLIVAKAMKAELEQYEGVTVYLTRTDDTGLTLEERCQYAADVNADFLFCLHFNMSAYHTLFGAETWVSAFGEGYSKGYAFANIEMELLQEKGLYSRGIKTRLNDAGLDYYGILRHSRELNFPCVLIEHCHLDQENDKPFYDHKEKLEDFGRLDAEAVAKYFGLRSESLNKDFSDYQNIEVPVPTQVKRPDSTEPDICMIDLVSKNESNGEVTISVSAADYDSGMLYYTYSIDGGETFTDLQRWPDKGKDTFEITITIPSGMVPQIIVNAYNGYDLYTTSNALNLPSMSYGQEPEAENKTETAELSQTEAPTKNPPDTQTAADEKTETVTETVTENINEIPISSSDAEDTPQPVTMGYFLKVCLICAVLVFAMALSIIIILRSYKKRRRRRYK